MQVVHQRFVDTVIKAASLVNLLVRYIWSLLTQFYLYYVTNKTAVLVILTSNTGEVDGHKYWISLQINHNSETFYIMFFFFLVLLFVLIIHIVKTLLSFLNAHKKQKFKFKKIIEWNEDIRPAFLHSIQLFDSCWHIMQQETRWDCHLTNKGASFIQFSKWIQLSQNAFWEKALNVNMSLPEFVRYSRQRWPGRPPQPSHITKWLHFKKLSKTWWKGWSTTYRCLLCM